MRLAFDFTEQVFGPKHEELDVKRNVPSLLAAVGLAHDLGNPPFGHQGEIAIQQWFRNTYPERQGGSAIQCFRRKQEIEDDFLEFDGNAQTFRLLTRLQMLNDQFGLNLTVATLAALVKYPSVYGSGDKKGYKKYGIFRSEKSIIDEVWEHTGLQCGVRHPLAYVMEACDDIAYSIIDAEDTVKKGYASFYDLMDYLDSSAESDPVIKEVVEFSRAKNAEFRSNELSSRELNDISMQMFRVKAIAKMVDAATAVFVENSNKILAEDTEPGFELIKHSTCAKLCKTVKDFDLRHGFRHMDVLRLELEGNNYIQSMMGMVWKAIIRADEDHRPFERYVFGAISENYRRVFLGTDKSLYAKHQLLSLLSKIAETAGTVP